MAPAPLTGVNASKPAFTFIASAPVIEYVDPSPAGTCAAPMTEYASSFLAAAYAAPDTVIEYVAPSPAGTCAAPMTDCAPAAADAALTLVSDNVDSSPAASVTRAEATFEISGADGGGDADLPAEVQPVLEAVVPESTDVTERWGDADMSESMTEMSEDAAETSTGLELDVVLDALSESCLGRMGGDWVRVRRVQALTSLATAASGGTPRSLGKHGSDPAGRHAALGGLLPVR